MSLSSQYSVSAKSRPSHSDPSASMPPLAGARYSLLGERIGTGLPSSGSGPAGYLQSRCARSNPTIIDPSGRRVSDSASWFSLPTSGRPLGARRAPMRASVISFSQPRSS